MIKISYTIKESGVRKTFLAEKVRIGMSICITSGKDFNIFPTEWVKDLVIETIKEKGIVEL